MTHPPAENLDWVGSDNRSEEIQEWPGRLTIERWSGTLSTRGDEREPQEIGGEPVVVGAARPQVAGVMLHTQPIK